MPISFRITHSALDKDEICIELRCILAEHDYDRFVLVSHSYGSIISSFIITDQILRPKVASALLVDPVTFLLHTPDVAYNFTVRQPRRANEWQLWYFASKDPGIAHALGRRFFWSQNVMWKKDVEGFVNDGRRLTVSLGGKDLIVNTEAVGRYLANSSTNKEGKCGVGAGRENKDCISLCSMENAWKQRKWEGNGLDVLWFDHLDHGQAFDRNRMRANLVKVVQNYCESG
jgi:pimeloyl-ACP methyl ester carboxylesterase